MNKFEQAGGPCPVKSKLKKLNMSGGREPGPWTEGRGQGPVVGGGHMVGPLPPVDRETRLKTLPSPLR